MKLELIRHTFTEKTTVGTLRMDGEFNCYTLEDRTREADPGTWKPELKVPGRTAIPYGTYEIVNTFSQRFRRALPLLLAVPDFEGVRIHAGNTEADTQGCILVGRHKGVDFISESTVALSLLYLDIQRAIQSEKVFIEIRKGSA